MRIRIQHMLCQVPVTVILLAQVLICLSWGVANAQSFEVSSIPTDQMEGVAFTVSFVLRDAQEKKFTPPNLGGFKLVSTENEIAAGFANGKAYRMKTWHLTLEPKKSGQFTIGPATVTLSNGEKLSTKLIPIKVAPIRVLQAITPPPGSSDIFIVGITDKKTVYPGQQVTWQLKVYTQINFESADLVELPKFEGFFSKEKKRYDNRVSYENIKGKRYAVKILDEEALFPQKPGEWLIGTSKVRIALEEKGYRVNRTLQALPAKITVIPLPDPTPQGFTGAVGNYTAEFVVDRDSLNTDDAITLKVMLKGNGDPRRFSVPVFDMPVGLESFEPRILTEEEYESVTALLHTKTLEYIILPKAPGTYFFQPLFTVFNPDSNKFQVIKSVQIDTFTVVAGPNYRPPQDTITQPSAQSGSPVAAPRFWWSSIEQNLNWIWIIGITSALLFGLGVFRWIKKWPRTVKEPYKPEVTLPVYPVMNPNPIMTLSKDRFGEARSLVNSQQSGPFYSAIFEGLQTYLCERLQIQPIELNQETVRKRLSSQQVPGTIIQMILVVWQTCEQALYAGQSQTAQMETTLQNAEIAIRDLEKLQNNA